MKRFSCIFLLLSLLCSDAVAGNLFERLRERLGVAEESPAQSGNAFGKISLPTGTRLISNLAYGEHQRQRMDVYVPQKAEKAAVIFMVHGGAWRMGDKAAQRVVQNKLIHWSAKGFVFVSVNYRLIPDAYPLDQLKDITRALAYAQRNASQWGADPEKFILMGHSAGAHLVSLLSAQPSRAFAAGARPWRGTVALDSAAFDLVQVMERKHYDFYDEAFGENPDYWRSVSPLYVLTEAEAKLAAPIMAVCSTQRPDKPCEQAEKFASAAKKWNLRVDVLPQNKSHGEINGDLGLNGIYTDAVNSFIDSLQ